MPIQRLEEFEFLPESFSSFPQIGTRIHQFEPQMDFLEWSTCILLSGVVTRPPGSVDKIEQLFKRLMKNITKIHPEYYPPFVYANPAFLVASNVESAEFLRKANEARESWQNWLKSFLRSSFHREYKKASKISRQLTFSGVLVFDHKHRFPNTWPTMC